MKITSKLMLCATHNGWATKKIIYSGSSNCETSNLHFAPEDLHNKRIVSKNCVENYLKIFLIQLCRTLHTSRKRSLLLLQRLYKSKIYLYQQQSILCSETSCISSIAPLKNTVSTAIKCSVLLPDNYVCSSNNDIAT